MYSAHYVRLRQFWKVNVGADNTVVVEHGVRSGKGRSLSRAFKTSSEADKWARAGAASKAGAGYMLVVPVDPTKRVTRGSAKRRAKEEEAAALAAAKKLRRSPRGRGAAGADFALQDGRSLGEVDAHARAAGGTIVTLDGGVCDVMLVAVDVARCVDEFLVLQLIQVPASSAPFVVFKRWGMTGTVGQTWRATYSDLPAAAVVFASLFKQAAGYDWGSPPVRAPLSLTGSSGLRFSMLHQDYVRKRLFVNGLLGAWQYWVNDGVDGKQTGWYDYTPAGNLNVEALFLEKVSNPAYAHRVVRSGTWAYLVNLDTMEQTNVTHGGQKCRRIRRIPPGAIDVCNCCMDSCVC